MIQFRGRLSFKQYHKGKPTKGQSAIISLRDCVKNNSRKWRTKGTFSELLVALWDVNIKVALATWLQKHSFDTEYTIRLLPTDDQHAKDDLCEKGVMWYFLA